MSSPGRGKQAGLRAVFQDRYTRQQPSQVTGGFWLYAERQQGAYPPATPRGGKWLIFASRGAVDALWRKIRHAVEAGQLGSSAKVSTARRNLNATDPSKHVICVYTYDSDDLEDVRRVRQALRQLGVRRPIPYKTDEATEAGQYQLHGQQRISKYYE